MKVFHLTAGFIYPQLLHEEENADLGLANPWYTCPSATKDPFALTPLGKKSRTKKKVQSPKHMYASLSAVSHCEGLLTFRQYMSAVICAAGQVLHFTHLQKYKMLLDANNSGPNWLNYFNVTLCPHLINIAQLGGLQEEEE